MKVRIHPHAAARIAERGATEYTGAQKQRAERIVRTFLDTKTINFTSDSLSAWATSQGHRTLPT